MAREITEVGALRRHSTHQYLLLIPFRWPPAECSSFPIRKSLYETKLRKTCTYAFRQEREWSKNETPGWKGDSLAEVSR